MMAADAETTRATAARGFVALPVATIAAWRLAGIVEKRIVCIAIG